MLTKITLVGSGEIGKAIQHVLSKKPDLEITLWSRSSPKPLSQVITPADFIFLCVPSWAMAEVMNNIIPHLSSATVLVSLAKGIDAATGKTMDELLRPPFALLAGPMLAEELTQDLPGSAVIATLDQSVFAAVARLFAGTTVQTEFCDAVYQVALASVLKNVYALGLGIAEAKKTGDNYKGWYIHKAVGEMALLVGPLAYSLAGLGDLVATGFSRYSTNRQTGEDLLAGRHPSHRSEGIHSLPFVIQLFQKQGGIPPLLQSIKDLH